MQWKTDIKKFTKDKKEKIIYKQIKNDSKFKDKKKLTIFTQKLV